MPSVPLRRTPELATCPPPSQKETPSGHDRASARGVGRTLGLGLITGAADDDPSAIGTYATAGAAFGPALLWTAPVTFPMMVAVVYLSSKLGQVTGKGLFDVIRDHYPAWVLRLALVGVIIGNTIEAGADIGGMAAAIRVLAPSVPLAYVVVPTTLAILVLQVWGSYLLIRRLFRWLALVLLAYVGAAFMADPDWPAVIRGTFVPTIQFNQEFLSLLVAIIGTTLSAYLYTWQSNEEVEEEIALGRRRLSQRRGATREELRQSRWDIAFGMLFSNIIMYFVILSTASTLHVAGRTDISTAAEAAEALKPLAGEAAGVLFAIGVIAVGFLAVPIMTTGAAYDVCQAFGWKHGLCARPSEAKPFYILIAAFTMIAMGMNFFGLNPMKALVVAGIVQGFSTPPLMFLIMRMTSNPTIMGKAANGRSIAILGWTTTAAIFAATAGLVCTWLW
jgi:NRAMP (natural resistance-associated macrophage protein)-like metal ion transporter